MLLYHFRDEQFGIKSIKEKRLKIARINELNDPFELLSCDLSDKNYRQAFNSLKGALSKTKGLLCFSSNWRSPVQWAHYADNHKGICMAFEIPNEFLMKVEYQQKRLACPENIDIHFMNKVLSTKFSHWKYEMEHRFFIDLYPSAEDNGLYFSEFSKDLELKQVIVGVNSKLKRDDLSNALGSLNGKVEVFKVRPAFRTFNIVMNKDDNLWT